MRESENNELIDLKEKLKKEEEFNFKLWRENNKLKADIKTLTDINIEVVGGWMRQSSEAHKRIENQKTEIKHLAARIKELESLREKDRERIRAAKNALKVKDEYCQVSGINLTKLDYSRAVDIKLVEEPGKGAVYKQININPDSTSECAENVPINCPVCAGKGNISCKVSYLPTAFGLMNCLNCNGSGKNPKFLSLPVGKIVSNPVLLRYLAKGGINTIKDLMGFSEKELIDLFELCRNGELDWETYTMLGSLKFILKELGLKLKE